MDVQLLRPSHMRWSELNSIWICRWFPEVLPHIRTKWSCLISKPDNVIMVMMPFSLLNAEGMPDWFTFGQKKGIKPSTQTPAHFLFNY